MTWYEDGSGGAIDLHLTRRQPLPRTLHCAGDIDEAVKVPAEVLWEGIPELREVPVVRPNCDVHKGPENCRDDEVPPALIELLRCLRAVVHYRRQDGPDQIYQCCGTLFDPTGPETFLIHAVGCRLRCGRLDVRLFHTLR